MAMLHMFQVLLVLTLSLSAILGGSEARNVCRPVKICVSQLERGKPCPLLPVPKNSFQDTVPEEGFALEGISPGVFVFRDVAYFSTILYKSGHLVLVDFPDTQASIRKDGEYLLLTAVNNLLDGAIPKSIAMVYSHRHVDHIGQARLVKQYFEETFPGREISIWGTSETLEFIRRTTNPRVPEPTIIVGESGATVDVAEGLKLELKVVGGHTLMDLACYVPPSGSGKGLVHLIDFFSTGSVPFLDFSVTIDFGRYIQAQKEVLQLDWEKINPGHGKVGSRFDLERNIKYTESVLEFARSAGSEVDPKRLARIEQLVAKRKAREFGNRGWALNASFQLLVDVCERKTIERWGCELAAVDVYASSHCKEAVAFTILDEQG